MPARSTLKKQKRSASHQASVYRVPSPLFALALLIEGGSVDVNAVRKALDVALAEADTVLARQQFLLEGEQAENFAHALVFDRQSQTEPYRKLDNLGGTEAGQLLSAAVDQALYLGVALGYRFFVGGGEFEPPRGHAELPGGAR